MRVRASDDGTVVETQLWVDGSLLATQPRGGPVGFLWDSRGLRPGSVHLLRPVARDACGNVGAPPRAVAVVVGSGTQTAVP